MKKLVLGILFCCVCVAMAAGIDVKLNKAAESLTLDGLANESSWAQAQEITGFTGLNGSQDVIVEQTRVKMLTDDNGLWLFVDCDDSDVRTVARPHDDSIWFDDCVEVFFSPKPDISPDRNIREEYHLIVNPSGSLFDAYTIGGASETGWSSMAKTATNIRKGGWSVEIYVPFAAIPNCHCDAWRFLIGRENWGEKYVLSSYPRALKFQEQDSYGVMSGLGIEQRRFSNELSACTFQTELDNDKMNCMVEGSIKTALTGNLNLKCRISDNAGKQLDFAGAIVSPKDGIISFKLPVKVTSSGKYRAEFFLTDAKGLVFIGNAVQDVVIAPCSVETLWPYYRDNIYASMADKTARFKITPQVSQAILKECRIEAKAVAEDGSIIFKNATLSSKEYNEWKLPLNKVKPGKVTVTFAMYRGENLLGKLERTINILPANDGGNEVWIDSEHRVVMNGKLFYPLGFFGCAENSFKVIADAGGNVVHSYTINNFSLDKIIKFLDEAHALNEKVVLKPYYRFTIDFWGFKIDGKKTTTFTEDAQKHVLEIIEGIGKHPAFLGWYLYDEPRGAEFTRNLKTVYEFLRKNDPYHLVVGCDNSSEGCINKKGHCDIHWVDIYPSPLLNPDYLSVPIVSLYNQLHSVVERVGREAVCYVPQAFDRNSFEKTPGNYRPMTYKELRASVFAGITAGVRGTVPYKIGDVSCKYNQLFSNAGIFSHPDMKLGFLKGIFPELRALNDVLLAPVAAVQAASEHKDVKQITFAYNKNNYVFLLNVTTEDLGKVAIKWPGKNVKNVRVLGNNGKVEIIGNQVVLPFSKYEAYVLTDDKNAKDTIDIQAVQKEIDVALK